MYTNLNSEKNALTTPLNEDKILLLSFLKAKRNTRLNMMIIAHSRLLGNKTHLPLLKVPYLVSIRIYEQEGFMA